MRLGEQMRDEEERERENWRSKESKCKWVVLKERVRKMRGKDVRGERR